MKYTKYTPYPNSSLVIKADLEMCLNLITSYREKQELMDALTRYMRGDYIDIEDMSETVRVAFEYFTSDDYDFSDLVLTRLPK